MTKTRDTHSEKKVNNVYFGVLFCDLLFELLLSRVSTYIDLFGFISFRCRNRCKIVACPRWEWGGGGK